MDDVYYKLAEIANLSFRDSLDYIIAKEMLQHIEQIPSMSIDKIADICITSTASITRFCQKIGYESFKELKYSIDQEYVSNTIGEHSKKNDICLNKAILNTKIKFDYLINNSLLVIEKSKIEILIEKIVNNERIAIFCASHEISAVILFQALLKKYHKKVDVIICNTEVDKMEYVLENIDVVLFLTYGGRWMRRSHKLINKILSTDIDNVVICLNDVAIRNYKFDTKIKFELSPELEGSHFEFFVFLFSVMSDAIVLYYEN